MITETQAQDARRRAASLIEKAGIFITEQERESIEVADFGLGDLEREGAQILTYFSTGRVSAKVLALFGNQSLPEHWHPPFGDDPGKEETVRCVSGEMRFYLPGDDTLCEGFIPNGKEGAYTSRHERILRPGDQLTLEPGTKHWFQAAPGGSVAYSFSTCVSDGIDQFSDPQIVRETVIAAS